jgi:hypothetical protein
MTSTNPFINRPTWDEVIRPLSHDPLWPWIRQAASQVLEARLHEAGDYESGIGSSDINHTIFGIASWVPREGAYAANVLSRLIDEVQP